MCFYIAFKKFFNLWWGMYPYRSGCAYYSLCVWLWADVDVLNALPVESARHQVFDALLLYTRSQGCRTGRRVGDLLLALPLLTVLVSAGSEFWRQTKARGHVAAHRLLSEMVDHILTTVWHQLLRCGHVGRCSAGKNPQVPESETRRSRCGKWKSQRKLTMVRTVEKCEPRVFRDSWREHQWWNPELVKRGTWWNRKCCEWILTSDL